MKTLENIGMFVEALLVGIRMTSLVRRLKKAGIDLSKLDYFADFGLFERIMERITDLEDADVRIREIVKIIKMEFQTEYDLTVKASES